jgi:hypothetical protein
MTKKYQLFAAGTLLVLLLSALAGCGTGAEERIEAERAEAEAQVWAEMERVEAERVEAEARAKAEAEERARLTPQWNAEDFGQGAAIAQTFETTNQAQWDEAVRTIDRGGNNKNYIVNIGGSFSGNLSFERVHSGLKISLRSGGAGENSLTGSFTAAAGETLILRDITLARTVEVAKGGTLILEGGRITGNNDFSGIVRVAGSFTMRGGIISGNSASNGCGVYVEEGGAFTMSGGEISGNSASGGVRVGLGGTFVMSGGEISGNSADDGDGGGVYVGGAFTMSGGEISGNSADDGGGVYVTGGLTISGRYMASGTFTMSGGEISGNSARHGGGVYVGIGGIESRGFIEFPGGTAYIGTFTMRGGTIHGFDAGDKANEAYRGAALFCIDRSTTKYGNGALILEGYRVDYINDTITGKR